MEPFPSDAELWARSQGGDREAFAMLFERHARAVYNHCFRQTANWSTAEDLMSAVFLEAWRRRERVIDFAGGDSVLPWLLGVTRIC